MNTGGGISTQGRHSSAMPEAVVKGELLPCRRKVIMSYLRKVEVSY